MQSNITIERSTEGLSNHLFEELELLRGGDSNPNNAKAVVSLSAQIYNTARLKLDIARFVADQRAAGSSADATELLSLSL